MTVTILIIVFYVIPAVIAYFGVRYQYKHEWTSISPGILDFIMIFTPGINWGYAVFTIMITLFEIVDKLFKTVEESKVNKEIERSKFADKFFRLK